MSKRRLTYPLMALVLFAFMGQDDSGCSTETVNEPDSGEPEAKKAKKQKTARVGDALRLKGADTQMRVTVLKVIDPIQAGQFDTPSGGNRYLGVQVKIENVGVTTYSDSPSNGAELLMSDDSQAEGTFLSDGPCTADFGSSAKVSPGSAQQGCLPFEAKRGLRPKTFQFGLDSGFGPQSGEWRLR